MTVAFGGREDLESRSGRGTRGPQPRDDAVDRRVVARRIVMGEGEAAHAGNACDLHRVLDGAVAPALLGVVFVGDVLRVVDQEVGVAHEIGMAAVAALRSLRCRPASSCECGSWSHA